MSLSSAEISGVLGELTEALVGCRIRRIHQQDPQTLLLRTKESILCISCHPRACRIHLVDALPDRIGARDFCMVMRRRAEGRRITGLDQPDLDRCVRIHFEERQPDTPGLTLCAELTGRHGNLLLLYGDTILGSLLPNRSRKRPLSPGQPYVGLAPSTAREVAPSRFNPDAPSAAITAHYGPLLETWRVEDLRRSVSAPLQGKLRSRRRLVRNLRRDRQNHEAKLAGQRAGDLLLAQLAKVKARSDSVALPDLFFDGEGAQPQVLIALDPRLGPADNAQRYYRQASKARRGIAALDTRIPEIEAEVTQLEVALATLSAADAPTMERLAADAKPQQIKQKHRRQRQAKGSPRRTPYLTFEAIGGEPILVGRSASDNDRLTFSVARGRDAWLHARDVTGSHVVLRLDGGGDPPHESLVDAACLAKHYSDARKSAHADITWTHRKHVRSSSAAGRVYVAQGHTLRVSEDPARLRRLQEGRSETARLLQGLADNRDPD